MKALIMSVKAGYGHHSAGRAMQLCFEKHGVACEMLDTFEYINKYLCEGIQDGYLLTTKYLKEAYGKVYDQLDKKEEPFDRMSPAALVSKLISKKLVRYIQDFAPDFVIGTHSYAAVLMTLLRQQGVLHCPLLGVVTDFTVHPFWESTDLDYYVLPDELLTRSAMKKGIAQEKILPIGIPIREEFSKSEDKHTVRERLGLKDKTTLLVMMGSMGFGNLEETIRLLDDYPADFQMITVCGSNERAKKAIDSGVWKKDITNLGFVQNIPEYMDAADLILTKPGGLTTSEALAKGLPMILMNPIPGQEERNMQFLVNTGAALMVTDTFPVECALYQFFECPWRWESMLDSVAHIGKPDSTEALYRAVMERCFADREQQRTT